MFSKKPTIPSFLSNSELYLEPSGLLITESDLPELLVLARLRKRGVGFSLFKQLNNFIVLTFEESSASNKLLSSFSAAIISSILAAKSLWRLLILLVRIDFLIFSVFLTHA
jgi:hypothetical protein